MCGNADAEAAQVMEEIVQRTASAMVDRGIPFSGILFAGLMIKDGKVCCTSMQSQSTDKRSPLLASSLLSERRPSSSDSSS